MPVAIKVGMIYPPAFQVKLMKAILYPRRVRDNPCLLRIPINGKVTGIRAEYKQLRSIRLYQNLCKGAGGNRCKGIHAEVEAAYFLPRLAMKASYTYLNSQDLSGVGRDEVQYVPRDKLTVTGKYDFDFGLTPFVSVIYAANSFVYTKQQIATVGKAKLADYLLVNLKLTQKLYRNKLTMYVGVDNLFNRDYEQSYGVPRPGRLIFGGLEYRFDI